MHAEIDLTDRCNVACYFCNQQDLRTKEQLPLPRLETLIDEMAAAGLRSVRLSGGGDPLFHKSVMDVLQHLAKRSIVIDNLTTNGVALTKEISDYLVENRAREVIVSLNTANAADYHRMMRVKPELFTKVVENVRTLIARRGKSRFPGVVLQFLVDGVNLEQMVDMYELGAALGVDRIAVAPVLQIWGGVIEQQVLLRPEDAERARPVLEEVLQRDRENGLLQIDFSISGWNAMLAEARRKVDAPAANLFPTAPTFRDENEGCFFAWYTTTITGNGDVRPCCLLLNPDVEPLGNVNDTSVTEIWNNEHYQGLRDEMREILLGGGKLEWAPHHYRYVKEPCVKAGLCWLKNMYFRADEDFYRELGEALDATRKREIRFLGNARQRRRALERFLHTNERARRAFVYLRDRSHGVRSALQNRFGVKLVGRLGVR